MQPVAINQKCPISAFHHLALIELASRFDAFNAKRSDFFILLTEGFCSFKRNLSSLLEPHGNPDSVLKPKKKSNGNRLIRQINSLIKKVEDIQSCLNFGCPY